MVIVHHNLLPVDAREITLQPKQLVILRAPSRKIILFSQGFDVAVNNFYK